MPGGTLFERAGIIEAPHHGSGKTELFVLEALSGAERLTPERRAQLVGYLERLLEEQASEGTK